MSPKTSEILILLLPIPIFGIIMTIKSITNESDRRKRRELGPVLLFFFFYHIGVTFISLFFYYL